MVVWAGHDHMDACRCLLIETLANMVDHPIAVYRPSTTHRAICEMDGFHYSFSDTSESDNKTTMVNLYSHHSVCDNLQSQSFWQVLFREHGVV